MENDDGEKVFKVIQRTSGFTPIDPEKAGGNQTEKRQHALILLQSQIEPLLELGYTEEAAKHAVQVMIDRGRPADQIVHEAEDWLQDPENKDALRDALKEVKGKKSLMRTLSRSGGVSGGQTQYRCSEESVDPLLGNDLMLLNFLSEEASMTEMRELLQPIEDASHILAWGSRSQESGILKVESLELPRLRIKFKPRSDGRIYSTAHKGWFIASKSLIGLQVNKICPSFASEEEEEPILERSGTVQTVGLFRSASTEPAGHGGLGSSWAVLGSESLLEQSQAQTKQGGSNDKSISLTRKPSTQSSQLPRNPSTEVAKPLQKQQNKTVCSLFDALPHSILLQNDSAELQLLVPSHEMKRAAAQDHLFGTDIMFNRASQQWLQTMQDSRVYMYRVHTSNTFIEASQLESLLYLILAYMHHRDYSGAFALIEAIAVDSVFTVTERWVFDRLGEVAGSQPDLHACRLKLILALQYGKNPLPSTWQTHVELNEYIAKLSHVSISCRLTSGELLIYA